MKFTLSPKEGDLVRTACDRVTCLPPRERREQLKDYCPVLEESGNGGFELFVPEGKRVAVITLANQLARMDSTVAKELAGKMLLRVNGVACV